MKNIQWFFNRIKAMSYKELCYRANEKAINTFDNLAYRKNKNILEINLPKNINESNIEKVYLKLEQIFQIKDIEVEINDLKVEKFIFHDIKRPINYHKGMFDNWNCNEFSTKINYRDSDKIGDIRASWEINRNQFMPYLALCYENTKDSKYIDILKNQFYTWIDSNFYLKGINWKSSMEVAIRGYQWLISLALLKNLDDAKLKIDLIKAIIISITYVRKRFSKYSSANNHLIIEAYITSIIGYIFSDIYQQDWFEFGYKKLKENLGRQFWSDGVNKEQALHYQAFVTDAMLQYNFFLKKIGHDCISEDVIRKSLEFIKDTNAELYESDFGDSDDACLLNFHLVDYNYYTYVLQLGSVYYNINYTNELSLFPEVKFISSYRNNIIENFNEVCEQEIFKLYEHGGYCIINEKDNFFMLDVADLGFGELCTHGHADALSIIYFCDKEPVFVDSGTYIYTIKEKKRNYYRSTLAHNTLCYDNKSQSEIKGPGIWGKKANSKLNYYNANKKEIKIIGEHDGYYPFIHTREIIYSLIDSSFIIKDYFDKKAVISFIIDYKIKVSQIDSFKVVLKTSNKKLLLISSGKINIIETTISKNFTKEINTKKIIISSNSGVTKTKIEILK
ncbi:alginate lyase family protein [Clostridium perfringens]|uniref:alginate lyase family protein n=1 Tax=Clostridium perfringens TaxID=1502 RepID=UPI0032D9EEED